MSPASDPPYAGPERRQAPLTTDRVALMIETAVAAALERHEARMLEHIDDKFQGVHKLVSSAFPDGDVHGHRLAHERKIQETESWNKLKAEVLSKFLSGGLWVAVGWLALAVWQSFKEGVKS